ncbi:alpha-L-fucosidase [Sinomicrobium weinanense]|uniref:alpha-L-fucosidase n=1 Tax=Sinomicrobium weinanense TaxID=2842200 RepID=A0A926JV34_9FLAO|nr:alpha-L-fucosidase [Sinomicrobium weinanense]MBC9798107.1 alpha-L-fucosidase [Sinomicrobium weinanense]MBU3122999.1 alpha-L-fucosidase [Sinomicrobium weinanense]
MRTLHVLVLTAFLAVACKEKQKEQKPEKQPAEKETVNYLEESEEAFDQRMAWWRDARFGMFIHWGAYAVPAGRYEGKEAKGIGEWIMYNAKIPVDVYEEYAKQFNPTEFDAEAWVSLMKKAGMKYLVITSKHHDGFCLWDSKITDYDIVDFSPYGKDVLKALSDACKAQGIKFGLYHSIMDWHHPDSHADTYAGGEPSENNEARFADYLENYLKPQLKELVNAYDPTILWFDGEWEKEFTHEQGLALYEYVRSLKPEIIINNRVDKGRQGMQGMNRDDSDYAGDFGTPEQEILDGTSDFDWESCMTMNDTWGYKTDDNNWKSSETLIRNLVDVAAKGGNYLLNVGPDALGNIPDASVERLEDIGEWIKVNGEAIYGTESPDTGYKQGENIRFTRKKGTPIYYAVSFEKPGKRIRFDHLKPEEGSEVLLLGYDEPLEWKYTEGEGVTVSVPRKALRAVGSTKAWTFKIKVAENNTSSEQ